MVNDANVWKHVALVWKAWKWFACERLVLLRCKLGELSGNLKTNADKLRWWQEVKDQQSSALEPWSNDDEERCVSLIKKHAALEDTALGRQRKCLKDEWYLEW